MGVHRNCIFIVFRLSKGQIVFLSIKASSEPDWDLFGMEQSPLHWHEHTNTDFAFLA